jgi:hypothetical protein
VSSRAPAARALLKNWLDQFIIGVSRLCGWIPAWERGARSDPGRYHGNFR